MRSVLDELVRVKSVKLLDGKVYMLRQDYSQEPNEQKLFFLELCGMSTGELLETLTYNDKEKDINAKRYQKLVLNRNIPVEKTNEAIKFINSETDKLLIKIDNKLSTLSVDNSQTDTKLLGLGAYYFEENNHEK